MSSAVMGGKMLHEVVATSNFYPSTVYFSPLDRKRLRAIGNMPQKLDKRTPSGLPPSSAVERRAGAGKKGHEKRRSPATLNIKRASRENVPAARSRKGDKPAKKTLV